MLQSALILAFVYYIVYLLDCSMAWDATWRPLFVAFLTGLALGDMKTGLIMGASLEAIYMGISAIGGVIPSDPCSASILSVAFVVLTGADLNLALALAVPIGTVMQYVSTLISPIDISLVGLFEKFAREGKDKSIHCCIMQACLSSVRCRKLWWFSWPLRWAWKICRRLPTCFQPSS